MRKQTLWGKGNFTIGMTVSFRPGSTEKYRERVRLETSVEYIGGIPIAYHGFGDVVGMANGITDVEADRIVVEGRVMDCRYDRDTKKITLDIETALPSRYREKVASFLARGRVARVEFADDIHDAFTK